MERVAWSSVQTLKDETKSWERDRNANQKSVDWQFKTDDARIKLSASRNF